MTIDWKKYDPGECYDGLISSPGYRNLHGGLPRIRRALADYPEIVHVEIASPDETRGALATFEREGVEVIAVNGGDGTFSYVLTQRTDPRCDQEELRPERPPYPGRLQRRGHDAVQTGRGRQSGQAQDLLIGRVVALG